MGFVASGYQRHSQQFTPCLCFGQECGMCFYCHCVCWRGHPTHTHTHAHLLPVVGSCRGQGAGWGWLREPPEPAETHPVHRRRRDQPDDSGRHAAVAAVQVRTRSRTRPRLILDFPLCTNICAVCASTPVHLSCSSHTPIPDRWSPSGSHRGGRLSGCTEGTCRFLVSSAHTVRLSDTLTTHAPCD